MPKKEETPEERDARLAKLRQKRAEKKAAEGPAAAGAGPAVETPPKAKAPRKPKAKTPEQEAKAKAKEEAKAAKVEEWKRMAKQRGETAYVEKQRQKLGLPKSAYEEAKSLVVTKADPWKGRSGFVGSVGALEDAMSRLSVSGGGAVMLPKFAY